MNPNIIPMSSALRDPKWFHDNKGKSHWFIDKNSVVNGFRIESFVPGPTCHNLCRGKEVCGTGRPQDCEFLKAYAKQLSQLNFDDMMKRFAVFEERYKKDFNIDGDATFAILVHEAPQNLCSERRVIQEWFRGHGIKCDEFQPLQNK